MIYEVHIPVHPLNQFIESFVFYKDYSPDHSIDRFLPDGNVNLIFDLTDRPKFIYDNYTLKEIQSCNHVWFSGIRSKYITIPSGKDSEMFIVNFHKGKAYPFIEMPLNELTDYVVDGQLVMNDDILNFREVLLATKTSRELFLKAESYFLSIYKSKLLQNPFVEFAVNKIITNPDQTTIKELSAKVGYSQKHLIKIFETHVGLSPKAFLKVIRFQKAITDIAMSKEINWSRIAYDAGFYDQAHFINDFKSFSGFSPSQYLQMQQEFQNYIAVG
ncbi:MAG: AraC family transcriptional regulator [Saprospiraceae bacterium]